MHEQFVGWDGTRPEHHKVLILNIFYLLSSAGALVIFQEGVVVFALRNIFWGVALLRELIIDQAQLTALLSGGDTVQADEELGAVVGISVLGVGVELSELVDGSSLGTLESAFGFISISLALLPVGDLGPVADAGELIEPESGGAGVLLGDTIDTGVEDVAHGGVGVGVETVQSGAKVAGALGGLELKPVSTVNVEIMITRFPLSGERIEN